MNAIKAYFRSLRRAFDQFCDSYNDWCARRWQKKAARNQHIRP